MHKIAFSVHVNGHYIKRKILLPWSQKKQNEIQSMKPPLYAGIFEELKTSTEVPATV